MKKMIDLFAGAGGLSLGLNQSGFIPVFANEIDPIPAETYKYNHKITDNNFYIGDIKDLNKNIANYKNVIQNIDLVCGGPPCQGFSTANRQRMIDDPRNYLYKEFLIFLNFVKPKFFIIENVIGMKNKINEILEDIDNLLDIKYNISYSILNAKDFGVPQNRKRFFIIGNMINLDSEKIFNKIKNKKYNKFILRDAIEGLPYLKANKIKNNTSIENSNIGFFEINYNYNKNDFYNFINNNKIIDKLYNHKARYNNERDIEIYSRLPQGTNSTHESISDIMPYKNRLNIFKDKYYKMDYNDISKTITSHMKFDCNMYIHPTQPRGLTPREAARIQTFPDDYIFKGTLNSWYMQIGNAVPVKLAKAIGDEVIKCL